MTPEGLFHSWYGNQASLIELLPVNSVFTGQVRDENQALPYATIRVQRTAGIHTNTGRTYEAELEFESFSREWLDGRSLCDEMFSLFDNANLSGSGIEMTRVRFIHEWYMQEPDGVEHFLQRYSLTIN